MAQNGEFHLFNPETIHTLQKATAATAITKLSKNTVRLINEQATKQATLRGLLQFKEDRQSVPIEEVESVEEICQTIQNRRGFLRLDFTKKRTKLWRLR